MKEEKTTKKVKKIVPQKKEKKVKKKIILSLSLLVIIMVGIGFLFVPLFKNLKFGLDLQGGFEILYKATSIDGSKMNNEKLTATYKTLSKRIDSLGVSEPEIVIEGNDKIRVKLAGVANPEEARTQLSTIATLSFRDMDDNLLMTSDVLKAGGSKISQDSAGNPAVLLQVKDQDKFYEVTKSISEKGEGNNYIVIWLDYNDLRDSFEKERGKCGTSGSRCLSAATVSQGFASDVIIQGSFTQEEVSNLVDLINSGSLPSKLTEISSNTVGASFGEKTLSTTLTAGIIAIVAIALFLILIYHFAGFVSAIAVLIYTFLVFLIFWLVGGVLTLPGIAALVLGIGMAVDSNVITFARIKEELLKGKSLPNAFREGSKESFSAILDSNLTTLIVAIIMFIFGESSIKGFATMLIITIIVTMFTMVFLTRFLLKRFVKTDYFNDKLRLFLNVNPKDVPDVSKNESAKEGRFAKVDFLGKKYICLALSCIVIVVGAIFFALKGFNLSIDYKTGTDITVVTEQKLTKEAIKEDLKELELKASSITISTEESVIRIDDAIDGDKVKEVNAHFEDKYDAKVNIGVVTNIVQRELVKNAILSVLIALLGIIVYVSIRFKFSYAVGGTLALIHDVLIMFAFFAIFRFQVSSMFIAAVLAIIGYSINDTIVSFDRVRENIRKYDDKKLDAKKLEELTNKSIQETFTRTIYTSITTLLPVVVLVVLGSSGILTFNVAMLVGLIAGTYSSIYIASIFFLLIEKKSLGKPKKEKKEYKDDLEEKKIKGINC
ncbi:MAG: protein translocase subunit SecD [Bacilli bacterium]|nr:protein translocase subunit SecD [Bacilli bacterium]